MRKETSKHSMEYFSIVILAIIFALTYELFIVKNRFAPSGVSGIATMVEYKFNFSIGYLSLIINIPLCIWSFFSTDKRFAVKSLVFSVVYSVSYLLMQQFDLSRFQYDAYRFSSDGTDTIFPCLIAGIISGFVYGISFRIDSSTGGIDIIAKYVSKKKQNLNFFWIVFAFNAAVAVISFFVYADDINGVIEYNYKPVCLCMLYSFVMSFVGDRILKGGRRAYEFFIITNHADKLEKEIIEKLGHSATRLSSSGIYTHKENEVLVCVVNKHQIVEFKNILKKYDGTFAFVETVDETIGYFRKIK